MTGRPAILSRLSRLSRPLGRWIAAAALWGGAAAIAGGAGCGHSKAPPPPPATVPPTKPDAERGAQTGIPVASSPQGLLKEGAEKALQQRLHEKGLLAANHRSGQLDTETREALRKFQKSEGLPATGLPSYETARHLGLEPDTIFLTTHHPSDPAAKPRRTE
jgi:peptidoglycan hydrolase-like protein with peptidoglycan-binding domain